CASRTSTSQFPRPAMASKEATDGLRGTASRWGTRRRIDANERAHSTRALSRCQYANLTDVVRILYLINSRSIRMAAAVAPWPFNRFLFLQRKYVPVMKLFEFSGLSKDHQQARVDVRTFKCKVVRAASRRRELLEVVTRERFTW